MGIISIIIIGFIAGLIARFLAPGPNRPAGFILTTALGIAGAFVATYTGQAIGWYRLDQGARPHRRNARRYGGPVCLEQAGRQPRYLRSGKSEGCWRTQTAPLALKFSGSILSRSGDRCLSCHPCGYVQLPGRRGGCLNKEL